MIWSAQMNLHSSFSDVLNRDDGVGGTGEPSHRSRATGETVSLSRWVNEMPVPLCELLSAHDVARLTRRRRWYLHALTLLRRFPKQQRFHDRPIGWARRDVMAWLAEDKGSKRCRCLARPVASEETPRSWRRIHVGRNRRENDPCSARRSWGES